MRFRSGVSRILRRSFLAVVVIVIVLGAVNLFAGFYIATASSTQDRDLPAGGVIVSLTSCCHRLTRELPLALRSLLDQTVPPREIRVYIPIQDRESFEIERKKLFRSEDSNNDLIKWIYVPDRGPGTKFLYVIEDHLIAMRQIYSEDTARQLILVCDDDHWYHPTLIENFLRYHALNPDAALGFRGWRVREDLTWGVTGEERKWHVIFGVDIDEIYRAGVITANYGYLIQPRFFYNNNNDYNNILNLTAGPPAAFWMDDIWMNGHLARSGVPRYILPADGMTFEMKKGYSLLDERKKKPDAASETQRTTERWQDNNMVLQHFGKWWEPYLWYKPGGINAPRYKSMAHYTFLWACIFPSWLQAQWMLGELF